MGKTADFLNNHDNESMSVTVSMNGGIYRSLFCGEMGHSSGLLNVATLNKLSIK